MTATTSDVELLPEHHFLERETIKRQTGGTLAAPLEELGPGERGDEDILREWWLRVGPALGRVMPARFLEGKGFRST